MCLVFSLSSLQININEKRVYSYLHENIIQIFFYIYSVTLNSTMYNILFTQLSLYT